jgi:hypothetical protein
MLLRLLFNLGSILLRRAFVLGVAVIAAPTQINTDKMWTRVTRDSWAVGCSVLLEQS